ncbi:CU044_5270 family protein [Arthrobacter sp. UYCu712]|uniref:CU044_5270 family protein n=1 Tax=Arthrobacter sp. UYCu712 TaxID=3156340 RepID=UPI0033978CD9
MRARTPVASDAAVEAGRRNLLQRIDPSLVTAQPKPRRRTAMRLALASAATVAIVGGLIAGDILAPAGGPGPGPAAATAAQVLNDAAQTTIQTADPVVNPGQYLKIDSTNLWGSFSTEQDGSQYQWLDTEKMTMYIPANRDDEWVWERSGRIPTTFFDEASKEYAQSTQMGAKDEVLRGENGAFYGPGTESSFPSPSYLDALPRDPRLLLEDIYQKTVGKGQSVDGEALVFIADLLRTGMVPGELRAALYKAAALIPGVTLTDEQATLDGRKGIAIGRVEDFSHFRQDIIIDPKNGLPIGERQVLTEPFGTMPAGTATTWTTVETSVSDTAP